MATSSAMAPPAFETQRLDASVAPPAAVSGGCRPHRRPPPRRPCLRRISAYSGGFQDRDAAVDSEAGASAMSAFNRGAMKKKLSFADQHDQELALEREFDQDEPVILMLIASRRLEADGAQAADLSKMRPPPSKDAAALDRWLYGALTQQELLSLCVVSCSFLGCVLLGCRHFIK